MDPHARFEVAADEAPVGVLDLLERRWPDVHRAYWRRLLLAGGVSVNFQAADPRTLLQPGDVVEVRHAAEPPRYRRTEGPAWSIVHREGGLCVATKAAGARFDAAARAALDPSGELQPVLRVEAAASGAVVLAAARQAALALFAAGGLAVEWSVLVEGVVGADALRLDGSLGPDRRRPGLVRTVDRAAKAARPALTEIDVVERFARHTLLRVTPRTDRGHQLRAHLASAGHPIAGDAAYGAAGELRLSQLARGYKRRPGVPEPPLLARPFLHAEVVRMRGAEGEREVRVPLPDDLARTLATLRRFAQRSARR